MVSSDPRAAFCNLYFNSSALAVYVPLLCMFITHQLVNAQWYLDTCKSDYCLGGKKDACTSFQSYFENCQTKGGPLIDWRAIKKECGKYILCIYDLDYTH